MMKFRNKEVSTEKITVNSLKDKLFAEYPREEIVLYKLTHDQNFKPIYDAYSQVLSDIASATNLEDFNLFSSARDRYIMLYRTMESKGLIQRFNNELAKKKRIQNIKENISDKNARLLKAKNIKEKLESQLNLVVKDIEKIENEIAYEKELLQHEMEN